MYSGHRYILVDIVADNEYSCVCEEVVEVRPCCSSWLDTPGT
jgi:hypothetical protein